jgi:hypothetical protein
MTENRALSGWGRSASEAEPATTRVTDDDIQPVAAARCEVVSLAREPDSPSERIRRLQWQARELAAEQVKLLAADLEALAARARDIAEGGEAYPVGVRDLAARLVSELPAKANILITLQQRNGQG